MKNFLLIILLLNCSFVFADDFCVPYETGCVNDFPEGFSVNLLYPVYDDSPIYPSAFLDSSYGSYLPVNFNFTFPTTGEFSCDGVSISPSSENSLIYIYVYKLVGDANSFCSQIDQTPVYSGVLYGFIKDGPDGIPASVFESEGFGGYGYRLVYEVVKTWVVNGVYSYESQMEFFSFDECDSDGILEFNCDQYAWAVWDSNLCDCIVIPDYCYDPPDCSELGECWVANDDCGCTVDIDCVDQNNLSSVVPPDSDSDSGCDVPVSVIATCESSEGFHWDQETCGCVAADEDDDPPPPEDPNFDGDCVLNCDPSGVAQYWCEKDGGSWNSCLCSCEFDDDPNNSDPPDDNPWPDDPDPNAPPTNPIDPNYPSPPPPPELPDPCLPEDPNYTMPETDPNFGFGSDSFNDILGKVKDKIPNFEKVTPYQQRDFVIRFPIPWPGQESAKVFEINVKPDPSDGFMYAALDAFRKILRLFIAVLMTWCFIHNVFKTIARY